MACAKKQPVIDKSRKFVKADMMVKIRICEVLLSRNILACACSCAFHVHSVTQVLQKSRFNDIGRETKHGESCSK